MQIKHYYYQSVISTSLRHGSDDNNILFIIRLQQNPIKNA